LFLKTAPKGRNLFTGTAESRYGVADDGAAEEDDDDEW
jgi:hypothetical protein